MRSNGSTKGGVLVRPPTPNCSTIFSHACRFCEAAWKQAHLHTDKQASTKCSCKHVQDGNLFHSGWLWSLVPHTVTLVHTLLMLEDKDVCTLPFI